MLSPDDIRTILLAYSAIVATILLIWNVVRELRSRPRLVIGAPTYKTVKETSTEVPALTLSIRNRREAPARVAAIYMVPPKGKRIVLKEKAAVGSVAGPFEIAPRGQRELTVSGEELAQQLESSGHRGMIRVAFVVQDEMNNQFTRKRCKLSIDRLKPVATPMPAPAAKPPTSPLPA